jgi:hypothetical protein
MPTRITLTFIIVMSTERASYASEHLLFCARNSSLGVQDNFAKAGGIPTAPACGGRKLRADPCFLLR